MYHEFPKIYGNNAQAVVVEKDGKIEYFNEAAARLIPNIETTKPEDIFPAELFSHKAERFIGEAEISGKNSIINVMERDNFRIFSIIASEAQGHGNLTNVFSAISYDLNNYLSVLKMASGLLLPHVENQENPRYDRFAAMVNHSYYNIQRIANNIRDFSGIMQNNLTLKRTSYDLIESCRYLIDSVRHLVSDRGVELCFESNLDTLIVYADKVRLDKLILNLLSNSLINTPAGGTIVLSVLLAEDRFILTVSDNGKGISPNVMQSAWSRYKEKRELSDQPVGIGLGLPIVQAIAKQHGGSVVLVSNDGEGTSVTVSIPMAESEGSEFKTSVVEYDNYDMQLLLTELSCVISSDKYSQKYMD